ncbi:MAG: metal-dependent hydrolase [bacterium]|nr:metal-dependent hydrolase [bacterium]
MTGKTHQILGISAGLTYFVASAPPHYNPATFGAVLVFSCLGALLPDIDQSNSKLWHVLPFGDTVGKISDPFLEHRNITHSILGVALVGVGLHFLLATFPNYWGINTQLVFVATMIAYVSHLFADMWTNEGIPLLFPYKRFFGLPPKPFDGIRIATGKWFENSVVFPAFTLFLVVYILLTLPSIKLILFK